MVVRILGCVGLVTGGSVPATGQLRGHGGWGHRKGSLGQPSTFPWSFWGSRSEGVAGWHGQRGRERGGKDRMGSGPPPALLSLAGLRGGLFGRVLPVKFQEISQ